MRAPSFPRFDRGDSFDHHELNRQADYLERLTNLQAVHGARSLHQASGVHIVGEQHKEFWAVIVDYEVTDGIYRYGWKEVIEDGVGGFSDTVNEALFGDVTNFPAFEVNNTFTSPGTVVKMIFLYTEISQWVYFVTPGTASQATVYRVTLTADQYNDVSIPTTAYDVLVTTFPSITSTAIKITGISGGWDGRLLKFTNVTEALDAVNNSTQFQFTHLDTSSSVGNLIMTPDALPVVVPFGSTVELIYDAQALSSGTIGAWRITAVKQEYELWSEYTSTIFAANTNDWDVPGARTVRASSTMDVDLTGLQNGRDGRLLVLLNVGAHDIILKHQSGSSSAGNRIICFADADINLTPDTAAWLQYDGASGRWRVLCTPGVSFAPIAVTRETLAGGSYNDHSWATPIVYLSITPGLTATITGVAGGTDGLRLRVVNQGTGDLIFTHQDAGSSMPNRIQTTDGQPLVVGQQGEVIFTYDSTNSWWIVAEYRQPWETWCGGTVNLTSASTTNNYALPNIHTIYIATSGSSAATITGMTPGYNGRLVTFVNYGLFGSSILFTNEDTGSSAANRFSFPDGFTFTLRTKETATFIWDSSASSNVGRWRLQGTGRGVMGASGTSHAVGWVPDPGSSAGTTKFLREDATWQVPPLTPLTLSHVGPNTVSGGLASGGTLVTNITIPSGGTYLICVSHRVGNTNALAGGAGAEIQGSTAWGSGLGVSTYRFVRVGITDIYTTTSSESVLVPGLGAGQVLSATFTLTITGTLLGAISGCAVSMNAIRVSN